jgi:outer membrane usher protein
VRSTLGDFTAAAAGFQNTRAMAGLNIARNFSLQPYRATEPIGRTSYLLRRPSRVEVFVNGRLVRTLQQAAGPHEVRDLPFASGTNDVRLRITDDVGNVEVLEFPYFFDSLLLAVGEEEFSASAGVPWRTELGRRVYDEDAPTFSGFYRRGVSDTFTLGSNLQADPQQYLLGAEALWASRAGTLRLDLGASRTDEAGRGFSARLQQRYTQVSAPPTTWHAGTGVIRTARTCPSATASPWASAPPCRSTASRRRAGWWRSAHSSPCMPRSPTCARR